MAQTRSTDLDAAMKGLSPKRQNDIRAAFWAKIEYEERHVTAQLAYWQRKARDASKVARDKDRYARSLEDQLRSRKAG